MNEKIIVRFETKEDFEAFVKETNLPITEAVTHFDFTKYNPIEGL